MLPANAHDIRLENDPSAPDLRWLTQLDMARPIATPALVARLEGVPVAALSLVDDRAVADPFQETAAMLVALRLRARGLRAAARQPSLRERMRAAVRIRPVAPAMP
jgi:hypothetical protein